MRTTHMGVPHNGHGGHGGRSLGAGASRWGVPGAAGLMAMPGARTIPNLDEDCERVITESRVELFR
jgi:hypothetical protein